MTPINQSSSLVPKPAVPAVTPSQLLKSKQGTVHILKQSLDNVINCHLSKATYLVIVLKIATFKYT